jgi:glutathione peroxidase
MSDSNNSDAPTSVLHIPVKTIDNRETTLGELGAKAYLVVNTASKCGFTPQYKGLETLWQDYRDKGLQVAAFPCNQFGAQEPDNEEQIAEFCELNFGVSFPLFAKVEVNGKSAHPLFQQLKTVKGSSGTSLNSWSMGRVE